MAVFHAVEDGNLQGIKELVENLTTFDPNQKNKVCLCSTRKFAVEPSYTCISEL